MIQRSPRFLRVYLTYLIFRFPKWYHSWFQTDFCKSGALRCILIKGLVQGFLLLLSLYFPDLRSLRTMFTFNVLTSLTPTTIFRVAGSLSHSTMSQHFCDSALTHIYVGRGQFCSWENQIAPNRGLLCQTLKNRFSGIGSSFRVLRDDGNCEYGSVL